MSGERGKAIRTPEKGGLQAAGYAIPVGDRLQRVVSSAELGSLVISCNESVVSVSVSSCKGRPRTAAGWWRIWGRLKWLFFFLSLAGMRGGIALWPYNSPAADRYRGPRRLITGAGGRNVWGTRGISSGNRRVLPWGTGAAGVAVVAATNVPVGT